MSKTSYADAEIIILILQGDENEYVGFTDEDYDYQFEDNSKSTIDENNHTSISINHILQYNSKNPYHPGYTIKIVRNKNKKENVQNKDRIRQEEAKKLEDMKFQKEIGKLIGDIHKPCGHGRGRGVYQMSILLHKPY